MKLITNSPRETRNLAKKISKILDEGDVVILEGPLGVGKTTFIKGVVAALGVNEKKVRSPSFTIIKEYSTKKKKVFHIDLYRINRVEELFNVGYEDYLYEPEGITFIEWGERIEGMLSKHIKIGMQFEGENRRSIVFAVRGYCKAKLRRIKEIFNSKI